MFDIIVTLNPNHITGEHLRRFVASGVTIFRVNGSFLGASGVKKMAAKIRESCGGDVDILLDLPGFKPRFSLLENKIRFKADEPVRIDFSSLNYPEIITHMHKGEGIRINNGMVRLAVDAIDEEGVVFIPDRSGTLRRGKGFYLERRGYRPAEHCLSRLDLKLIETAKETEIDFVGLSFVHGMEDIEHVRTLLDGTPTDSLPKIEARESLEPENLVPILAGCGKVILDRGDMSGEVGLESLWHCQRKVLNLAKLLGCRVIMATQFFTHMIKSPLPSIAEIDSFYDLLYFGIDGVQLSEETCVGSHGFEVVRLVKEGFERSRRPPEEDSGAKGHVVWIMGPTSAGKTTLAKAVATRLKSSKIPAIRFDGDEIRNLLGPHLSFKPEDRLLVVKGLVHHARKMARTGANVIVSALTAGEESREFVRKNIDNLTVVYLNCSIEECARRDPKGLYARSFRGEINTLVGVNSEYKPPKHINITLDTHTLPLKECVDGLIMYLVREGKIRLWG